MPLPFLLGVYAVLLGLIVGSYLNVLIHRLPLGMSTVRPRSRCPRCDAPIRARDNVPLVSFLVLGGRCRSCGARIGWRYPAVEAATSLLFLACYLRFGFSWEGLAAAIFAALMLALGMIDFDHMILPDRLTWPAMAVGILLQPLLPWARLGPGPWWALAGGALGAAVGSGILLAVWLAWYLIRHEEGMGLGDVKMLAAIGAFLGWKGVLVSLFFAALSGAVVGLTLMAAGKLGAKSRLPFGVFLALGGLVALFVGERLVAAYARLL